MLAKFRDYLKTLNVAENYFLGKIMNETEKTLGVYSNPGYARVEAIGRDSSYDVAGFMLLLHWNRNARESEDAARNLYESIRYIQDQDMDGLFVFMVDLQSGEPNFIGTDDNGIYEFSITGRLFYRR